MVIAVAGYVQEASPDVRDSAKECFAVLGRDLDKVLSKYLPENVLKSVKEILDRDRRRNSNKSEPKRRAVSLKSTARRTMSRNASNRIKILQNFDKKGQTTKKPLE
jgi:hypothetical protein